MRTTQSVVVPTPADRVFPLVAQLDRYPNWLRLVYAAAPEGRSDADEAQAWSVELRARVGPFARSKQLRMIRVDHEPDRFVGFERSEIDGREHARWSLRVELESAPDASTLVSMHLAYDGALWTGGLLERVLDEEIRRGRVGLVSLVNDEPTH